MRRFFVALPISRFLKDEIELWQERHSQEGVRWVGSEGLHITLVPPWEAESPEEAQELLAKVRGEVFKINFCEIEPGPDSKRPRLVWLRGDNPEALARLKEECARQLGTEIDRRGISHVTLGRAIGGREGLVRWRELADKVDFTEEFDSLVLFESHLMKGGAQYEIIQTYKFADK